MQLTLVAFGARVRILTNSATLSVQISAGFDHLHQAGLQLRSRASHCSGRPSAANFRVSAGRAPRKEPSQRTGQSVASWDRSSTIPLVLSLHPPKVPGTVIRIRLISRLFAWKSFRLAAVESCVAANGLAIRVVVRFSATVLTVQFVVFVTILT